MMNNFQSIEARVIDFTKEKVFVGKYLGRQLIAGGTDKEFEQLLFADVETGEEVAISTFTAIEKALAKIVEKDVDPLECIFRFEHIAKTSIGGKSFHKFASGWCLESDYKADGSPDTK